MTFPNSVADQVTELLREQTGKLARIVRSVPVAEGWSAQAGLNPWPWIARCTLGGASASPMSVIVKVRRPEDHERRKDAWFCNEQAALEFLQSIGSDAGPRVLAADNKAGLLILEDLGTGPALEDVLMRGNPAAAEQALKSFARSLGRMHAAASGHADEYYRLRGRLGRVDPAQDRVSILGTDLRDSMTALKTIVASRSYLPALSDAQPDIDELVHVLLEPGAFLTFSNGDTCPANCRLSNAGTRFLDFEHAAFRHALLDVAALRFPFPACPCWSRVPDDVGRRAEDTYRTQMAPACPDVLDDVVYARGMTVACCAWTLVRAVRLPKLERADEPHPMGFSRRGQLLDAISTTIDAATQSRTLPSLAAWFASVHEVLSSRWPNVRSPQPLYPAFR